jgi:hypothetical protein
MSVAQLAAATFQTLRIGLKSPHFGRAAFRAALDPCVVTQSKEMRKSQTVSGTLITFG